MSLFPTYIENDEEIESEVDDKEIPREYEINFTSGQLTGRIVTGLEAIKVWVWKALKTPRYRFYIYSWDYGVEIEDLIGKGYSKEYIETESKRMVEDCLVINENITAITDFSVEISGDKIKTSFKIETLYGDIDIAT